MKPNASTALQTARTEPHWIQQLWLLIAAPIGNSSNNPQTGSAPKKGLKANTHSPKITPPPAVIGAQTLKAFSDYTDEYEPAHIALTDFIPDELSLLNISPAQAKASTTEQTDNSLIEVANNMTEAEEFDGDNDDEYLSAHVPSNISDISEDGEKTLPALSAL
ncbi:MAG: hypothetical protein DCF25_21310 [Leptolyngbya foveolarum]|uniref:Uncharacterized protein n=1 Tax=Leptolyngbya foveolarum TaxID=47253 RepID=A0A2W4TSV9_9CYAN|nr:MAG: hypothetical protein DCF25_21310 [Leptolyngbya foveolarum]